MVEGTAVFAVRMLNEDAGENSWGLRGPGPLRAV